MKRINLSRNREEDASRSGAEIETRDQLRSIASDLSGWVWTRKVLIDQDAIPHSRPVLTVHTRRLKDELLLFSTFYHEQYYWYETAHPTETAAAIAELKTEYPNVPGGGQDGASDEGSSYLHIIVCCAEYEKMKGFD